jgi:acetyl esterase/lipase
VGQLEDDLVDLFRHLRARGHSGDITLGGHSSGGGLAIRFAGSAHGELAASYLLLSPAIPLSPSLAVRDTGGWSRVHRRRLVGLVALNLLGFSGFNGLPVVSFNKPERFRDGTETLSYSYRLNVSYHPGRHYADDLRALGAGSLVLVGENDQVVDPDALAKELAASSSAAAFQPLPDVDHLGIVHEASALRHVVRWLSR